MTSPEPTTPTLTMLVIPASSEPGGLVFRDNGTGQSRRRYRPARYHLDRHDLTDSPVVTWGAGAAGEQVDRAPGNFINGYADGCQRRFHEIGEPEITEAYEREVLWNSPSYSASGANDTLTDPVAAGENTGRWIILREQVHGRLKAMGLRMGAVFDSQATSW